MPKVQGVPFRVSPLRVSHDSIFPKFDSYLYADELVHVLGLRQVTLDNYPQPAMGSEKRGKQDIVLCQLRGEVNIFCQYLSLARIKGMRSVSTVF